MAVLLFSLVVIGGGWALADLVEKVPLRIIADTDTPVPGQEGGTFAGFFQLNGVDPDISGRNVVFGACCPTGVYGWFDGELRIIANLDSTFPGTGNPLGFDFFDGSSPSISGENVAFSCRNGRPGPGAICAHINGELQAIALSGVTRVPGSTETFGSFFMLNGTSPSISGENVAFTGSSLSTNGIYARIDGELIVIADRGMPVPGQEGLTFLNFGQLSGISPSISGSNVAFLGLWSGGVGIYTYINGELRVITDSDSITHGKVGSSPSISAENVAFLSGGIGGISCYVDGQLQVIVARNMPAPGSKGMFGGFPVSPVIDGENVGFAAGVTGIGAGIYAYIDGGFELIANRNTIVPGHEDTTFDHFGSNSGMRPSFSGENMVFYGSGRLPGKQKQYTNGIYARIIEMPIPTVSTWSLIVLTALLLSVGTIIVSRRRVSASER